MWTNDSGFHIYVNADKTKVVPEGSPEAAFLLVGPHGEIPEEEARVAGLMNGKPKAEPAKHEDAAALEQRITEEVQERLGAEVRSEIEAMQKAHEEEIAALEKRHAEELEAARSETQAPADGADSKSVGGAPKDKAVSPDKDK